MHHEILIFLFIKEAIVERYWWKYFLHSDIHATYLFIFLTNQDEKGNDKRRSSPECITLSPFHTWIYLPYMRMLGFELLFFFAISLSLVHAAGYLGPHFIINKHTGHALDSNTGGMIVVFFYCYLLFMNFF